MTAFLFDTFITGRNNLLNYQYNCYNIDIIAAKQTEHGDIEEISAESIGLKATI